MCLNKKNCCRSLVGTPVSLPSHLWWNLTLGMLNQNQTTYTTNQSTIISSKIHMWIKKYTTHIMGVRIKNCP